MLSVKKQVNNIKTNTMAYDITFQNNRVRLDLVVTSADFNPQSRVIGSLGALMINDSIKIFDHGVYIRTLRLEDINEIGGEEPTTIQDAFNKINLLGAE